MNPFQALLQSRKFWLLILDTIVSVLTYFVGKYVVGAEGKDIIFLVTALQPIFLMAINSITREDVAQLQAGTHPTQTRPSLDRGPVG